MTMQDPIADMLTRIRNAQRSKKAKVHIPYSRFKLSICELLVKEGYIESLLVVGELPQEKSIDLILKYAQDGAPVITRIDRHSKPSLRQYVGHTGIKDVPGFGVSVVSTSQGVMSHHAARQAGIGGELLCIVS
jgi:small subunit ribosomal protein S8